ncbi:hypothetical protein NK8_83880 (plasmid) [Caballeronia sp. NK8]|nr:hypothetical protein NK8_83880 [Caballeronia sp. NK8]
MNIKRVIGGREGPWASMLAMLKEKFAAIKVGDPTDESTVLGPLVSERALQGLLTQIDEARAAGARIVHGGKRVERDGFYLEPTIITDIAEANPLFQQEAFGPVLSFYIVDSEQEAIRLANATKYGPGRVCLRCRRRPREGCCKADRIWHGLHQFLLRRFAETALRRHQELRVRRELSELGMGEFLNRKLIRVSGAA